MNVSAGAWIPFGVGIMVLEFILVHSGAMIASWQQEKTAELWKTILVMTGFYVLFAGAIAAAFENWNLFGIFTVVMMTRWASIVLDPPRAREEAIRRSGLSAIFYLLAVFATLFMPIPELGVTTSVLNDVYPHRGSGVWERDPEIALAAGVLYFSLLGMSELRSGFGRRTETGSNARVGNLIDE